MSVSHLIAPIAHSLTHSPDGTQWTGLGGNMHSDAALTKTCLISMRFPKEASLLQGERSHKQWAAQKTVIFSDYVDLPI